VGFLCGQIKKTIGSDTTALLAKINVALKAEVRPPYSLSLAPCLRPFFVPLPFSFPPPSCSPPRALTFGSPGALCRD